MPFVPFGEWLPDQPDFANPGAAVIQNVVPRTKQSYGPMASPAAYSSALTARCQGSYSTRDAAGNVYVFAADANRLYLLKFGSTSFVDVSKTTGGPYLTPALPDGFWSATSFGLRTAIPATWSMLTVRSLSVNQYVGAPPQARMDRSRQPITVGRVRSQVGITTR